MKVFLLEDRKRFIGLLALIMMLQLIVASYFCIQKKGFHYDEYYSYYSSNVTNGLAPADRKWKESEEIVNEFVVLPGEGFQYGRVKLMQTYDVHPPLYYFLLHTVCSFFPGVFSKWSGLGLNLIFFMVAYWLFARISMEIFKKRWMTVMACILFGFQPGIFSGITFIRMYMLLLVWCLGVICWHIPVWKNGICLKPKSVILLWLLVTVGFLTHYYFAVFLFFLAAYTCLVDWWGRKQLKKSIGYGMVVCLGMATAILLYPSSLAHILRGYRGTEATQAFFDLSNTLIRVDFFTDLMNTSVFGGTLWFLILLLLLMAVSLRFVQKRAGKERESFFWKNQGLFCLLTVTLGYFFVVAKTALLNAEEANRYELPVYGFWLLIILALFYHHLDELDFKGRNRVKRVMEVVPAAVILYGQLLVLLGGGVQFLYPEDEANVEWAGKNREAVVVYLYNPVNTWMIWDESEELMQYDKIYFVSLSDVSPITEEEILQADRVYLYSSRMEEGAEIRQALIKDGDNLETEQKIRELLYCDLYLLE